MGFISELFGYVLNWLYNLVNNYGVAIIIFSVLLRVILIPITIKQQKSMKKSAVLQKEMAELQKKYANQPEKLNQETMELYKREKMSPFSGCFSSILQLVIILSVFWLVSQPLTYMKRIDSEIIDTYTTEMKESGYNENNRYIQIALIDYAETKYNEVNEELAKRQGQEITQNSEQTVKTESTENKEKSENTENTNSTEQNAENKVVDFSELSTEELETRKEHYNQLRLNMEFLGIDLSKVPTQSLNDWRVYIIPVLYVITSFISIRLTTATQNKKKKQEVVENKEGKEEENPADQMQAMNKSMSYMMPFMSVMIASIAPLGLALYWLVSNVLMIIERLVINKITDKKESKGENTNG